jgi:hypothetical protein
MAIAMSSIGDRSSLAADIEGNENPGEVPLIYPKTNKTQTGRVIRQIDLLKRVGGGVNSKK